jgi:hypothetical protein
MLPLSDTEHCVEHTVKIEKVENAAEEISREMTRKLGGPQP